MSLRNQALFIAGHPKSGTSLLLAMLDSHPELIVYPEETNFFRRYLPLAKGKSLDEKRLLSRRHLTHIFEWNQQAPPSHQRDYPDRDYSNIPADSVRQGVERYLAERFEHEGDMLSAALLSFGETTSQLSDETKYWVEKTPYNEYYAGEIYRWWPAAKMIHIIRDPRDNFASYRRKQPGWSAEFFSLNWLRSTQAGFANRLRYGEDRVLLLRYEDLTTKLDQTIENICAFLGIRYSPSLKQPKRSGRIWKGNSMFDDRFTQISSAPVGRWKKSLVREDAVLIEALSALHMQKLDYPFSDIHIGDERGLRRALARRLMAYTIRRPRMGQDDRGAVAGALAFLENDPREVLPGTSGKAAPDIIQLNLKLFFAFLRA